MYLSDQLGVHAEPVTEVEEVEQSRGVTLVQRTLLVGPLWHVGLGERHRQRDREREGETETKRDK